MNCQIVGPRGIGKTTLLSHVAAQLGPRFRVALLDLTDPRYHTVQGFVEAISAAWGVGPAATSLADLTRPVARFRSESVRPLLGLDQFEELARRPEVFGVDFLLHLRGLGHEGITFLTASEKPLSQISPGYLPTSPFFNTFEIFYLGPFSPADSEDYLTLHQRPDRPLTPEERQAIVEWARGYPLRLEVGLASVTEAKGRGEGLRSALERAEEVLRMNTSPSARAS
jgi:hypothetical protein